MGPATLLQKRIRGRNPLFLLLLLTKDLAQGHARLVLGWQLGELRGLLDRVVRLLTHEVRMPKFLLIFGRSILKSRSHFASVHFFILLLLTRATALFFLLSKLLCSQLLRCPLTLLLLKSILYQSSLFVFSDSSLNLFSPFSL